MISIVNKKTYKGDGYYIGRPSPLGNVFSHLPNTLAAHCVASREEAIEKYREWLREKLKTDNEASREFRNLLGFYRKFGELTLICWCAPKYRCHGEVIRDFLLEAIQQCHHDNNH